MDVERSGSQPSGILSTQELNWVGFPGFLISLEISAVNLTETATKRGARVCCDQ
jgi:hypothetical protein